MSGSSRWWCGAALFAAVGVAAFALHGERITADPASERRFHLLAGDEPNYLIVAHSLAFDGDIDLRNNLDGEHWRAFYHRPVTGYVKTRRWVLARVSRWSGLHDEPDSYWQRRALPTQPIGTSALIAPVYRLGHHWGGRTRFATALFFHALLAALAWAMLELCRLLAGSGRIALAVSGALALSAPLLFYSVPVYPDLPGALLIALGLLLLARMTRAGVDASRLRAAALGVSTAALPWIHLRFWPTAVILALFVLWPTRGWRLSRATLAAFALPWLLSLAGLARYYLQLFGTPWPASTAPPFSLKAGLLGGWPGLLLDPVHGLLPYLPLAVFAFPGVVLLALRRERAALAAALLLPAYVGLVGANAGWHGGFSPPLRYWVPAVPLLAAAVAVSLADTRARGARVLAVLLGGAGPPIALLGMLEPARQFSGRHVLLGHGDLAPLWSRMPAFFPQPGPGSALAALAALAALGAFAWWVVRGARGRRAA